MSHLRERVQEKVAEELLDRFTIFQIVIGIIGGLGFMIFILGVSFVLIPALLFNPITFGISILVGTLFTPGKRTMFWAVILAAVWMFWSMYLLQSAIALNPICKFPLIGGALCGGAQIGVGVIGFIPLVLTVFIPAFIVFALQLLLVQLIINKII